MIVYSVTNKLNHKKYFCLTGDSSLKQAKWNHRQKAKCIMRKMKLKPTSRMGKSPFHKAYARDGETNFRYRVEDRFSNRTDAFACKERLISEYNTMNPELGYNCTTGGNKSFKNATHVTKRLSVANMGKMMPESWKVFMRDEVKNHPEKHPHFQKGYIYTDEDREKMRQGQLNSDYVQTEEHQRKKSETMKKRWQEPEVIAKMEKRKLRDISGKNNPMYGKGFKGKDNPMYGKKPWNYGLPMTEEQKKKLHAGRKKYHTKKRKVLLEIYSQRTEKKCYVCEDVKSLDMFYKSNGHLDGYAGRCISCEGQRKKKDKKINKLEEKQ